MSNQITLHLSFKARKYLLSLAAVAALVLFFLLPPYKTWLEKRIYGYYKDFKKQKNNLSTEYRKAHRFGTHYTFSRQIADLFRSKKDILVLIPPSAYFKQNGLNYEVPEPVVFYYFTGLRTVRVNSYNAAEANRIVTVKNRMLMVDSITDKAILKDSIALWKKLVKK